MWPGCWTEPNSTNSEALLGSNQETQVVSWSHFSWAQSYNSIKYLGVLLFSSKYFSIYFIFFKTTGDKAYSAVKMNFCPDSIDFPFVFSFSSQFQRKRKKCREKQSLSQGQQLESPLV